MATRFRKRTVPHSPQSIAEAEGRHCIDAERVVSRGLRAEPGIELPANH
jgi:hypothetical protein